MPMDMEASIPFADAPECESLQWRDNIDGYRQFAGPANLARRNVISNELGAIFGRAYGLTIPELLFSTNRAVAGGVNQFVIHGQAYTGNYPQTTWPGYSAWRYYVSDMYSNRRPDWDNGLGSALNYTARVQHIQQRGIPRTDVAFYNKQSASDPNAATIYQGEDLISGGWSYTYLSPENFALPQAHVRDKLLAPDDARIQAMVVLGSQSLTQSALRHLIEFSEAGLPIIIAGGNPGEYPTRDVTQRNVTFDASLRNLMLRENVYQVAEGEIADKLESIGLQPRVAVRTNGTWYTTWREEPAEGAAYAFVFGDLHQSSGEVVVQSSKTPYFLDPWTGTQEPVLHYTVAGSSTVIPLSLAGNQTRIIGFYDQPPEGAHPPVYHATNVSSNVLGYKAEGDGITFHAAASASSTRIQLSSKQKLCRKSAAPGAFELSSWQLVLEHWEAPENMSDLTIAAAKRNTTHALERLVSWREISAAANVSGIGYYSTNFTWPTASNSSSDPALGAYIQFSPALNAIALEINGQRVHPLDPTNPVADISAHLLDGENSVVAIVPSTMWNYVRSILHEVESGGLTSLAELLGVEMPPTENGLVGPVSVIPFERLRVTSSDIQDSC